MKITAAVLYEQGLPAPYAESGPFRIEEVDLDGPGPGEVLVEVRAAGLCHSDLGQVAGLRKRTLPVMGGHEGAGVVLEVGQGVKGPKPGDHVVMTASAGCGQCRPCIAGRPALCDSIGIARSRGLLPNGAVRLSRNGKPVYHYSGISSFAQCAVTMPEALIVIDPAIPLDVAALYGCAVVTGAGSVFNSARVRPGNSIAVIGLGGVGLNVVMAARISGASRIIGIDLLESKFPLARELGCTDTLRATDGDLAADVREMTGGGVDFAFDVTGNRIAMTDAFDMTRKGGEIVCVGLGDARDRYEYPHAQLVAQEKVLRGSFVGGGEPRRDIPQYLDYLRDGRMPVDRLMTGHMGFGELNAALDALHRGDVVRQVLLPNG